MGVVDCKFKELSKCFDIMYSITELRRTVFVISLKGSSIKYLLKIFRKTNISNPLTRTRTHAYHGIRNVSFSENFAYVLNGWLLNYCPIRVINGSTGPRSWIGDLS